MRRVGLRVRGTVQGVGFRPFVHRLANESALTGTVVNDGDGVWCEVQGPGATVDRFVHRIRAEAPPLAVITGFEITELDGVAGDTGFSVQASDPSSRERTLSVPADIAPCGPCRRELFDPGDRRFRYPFLCCTDCGPRFTVVSDLPYDRERTAMADFPLCGPCRSEYEDPADRRFHAQATCCGDCGPRLWLRAGDGVVVTTDDPVAAAVEALVDGRIVALKGVGGYQLLCRADNEASVARLRRAKRREEKPFALLALDPAGAESVIESTELDRRILLDPAAPILIAPRRPDAPVADAVAPDTTLLGLMLPSSPVHLLIATGFAHLAPGAVLVCTSGNLSDEPIVIDDDSVVAELGPIADLILGHNRRIERRADDSVGRVVDGRFQVLRRARGFAPRPIRLPAPLDDGPVVLAVGAGLKNTVGLAVGAEAMLSVHLGDLDHPRAVEAFETAVADLIGLIGRAPDLVAHDLHPEYLSTKFAVAADLAPTVGVQHHHAHLASCLTDAGRHPGLPVLGVTFDGLGWGPDGVLWGGEFLVGDATGYRRVAHLRPTVMPGGEAAIRRPWRMAVAQLIAAGIDPAPIGVLYQHRTEVEALVDTVDTGRSPTTTSMGRLFDAVAALCGVSGGDRAAYEGQAAIQLEQLATTVPAPAGVGHDHTPDLAGDRHYPVTMTSEGPPTDLALDATVDGRPSDEPKAVIDPAPMLVELVDDLVAGVEPATVAARFHRWVAQVVGFTARRLEHHGFDTVALTGGVFQNRLLTESVHRTLTADGFTVLTHRQVPPNDGGIALGQLAVARAQPFTGSPPSVLR